MIVPWQVYTKIQSPKLFSYFDVETGPNILLGVLHAAWFVVVVH
jgi:hypothetical protein